MITSSEFADSVGRNNLASRLGVGLTAVSNAVVRGKFPGSWFSVGQELALEAGIACPPELFSQRVIDLPCSKNEDANCGQKEACE